MDNNFINNPILPQQPDDGQRPSQPEAPKVEPIENLPLPELTPSPMAPAGPIIPAVPTPASIPEPTTTPVVDMLDEASNAPQPTTAESTTLAQLVAPIIGETTTPKKTSKRKWIIAGVVALIVIAIGIGTYLWLAPRLQPRLESYTNFSTLLYRASTMPTATVSRQGQTLSLESFQLPSLPVAQYNYSLFLTAKTADGLSVEKVQDFIVNADGTLYDLENNLADKFTVRDWADYNGVRVVINDQANNNDTAITVLEGLLPESGATAKLDFPTSFSQASGKVSVEFDATDKQYKANVDITSLPEVRDLGWKYEAWLVKMNGPFVEKLIPAGAFDSAGASFTTNTRHTYTTEQKLEDYTQLVVSLEPLSDTDENIFAIRPFSGQLVWNQTK
ncbi:MAG: hypothetical protein V1826_01330 [bacterium]